MPHPATLAHLAAVTTGAARTRPAARSWSVFCEDAAAVAGLAPLLASGALGADPAVFAPDAATTGRPAGLTLAGTPSAALTYRGALAAPGDRLWLDDTFVMEVQAYAVAGFLAVHGPTLLRLTGPEDLLALAADAATARDTGRLPRVAASPLVHLADTPALGWPGPDARALRLHVHADGSLSATPAGDLLGHLDHLDRAALDRIAAADPRGALAASVGPADVDAALADVPWLPRYLAVVAAVRAARSWGVEVQAVSGFGGRLDDATPAEDGTRPADRPVVVMAPDSVVVVDPVTGRGVPLDNARARALEAALDGAGDATGESVSRALASRGFGGIPQAVAA